MSKDGHVFISYSSRDIIYVNQMLDAMKKVGIEYWKAPDRIPAGSNYAKEIPAAINDCRLFLLILSEASQESIWVEKELDTAIRCHKKVLPVKIDNSELNDMFKFYLNNVQILQAKIVEEKWMEFDKIFECIDGFNVNVEVQKPVQIKKVDNRSNALRINRIPLECEVCGEPVKLVSVGVYKCEKCGAENYDDFYKVRAYLEKYGPAPAMVIAKNTGVSRATVEHFKNSGFLGDASQIIKSIKW